jgi:hypothetical protein
MAAWSIPALPCLAIRTFNDKTDWATSMRAGYMWHGFVDYGVELGYAGLNESVFVSAGLGTSSRE